MSTVPSRALAVLVPALGALLAAGPARADDKPAAAEPPPKPTWRSSFTAGFDTGIGFGTIGGYPNDALKIGRAAYFSSTGVRPAGLVEVWFGGAIMDWFNVGLGVTASRLVGTGSEAASSVGGVFHVEAFPLWALGGHLRDLGVRFDAGLGTANVVDARGAKVVEGAATSSFGGGFFYEMRHRKAVLGPFLFADYVWSETASYPALFVGWRAAFYAGP